MTRPRPPPSSSPNSRRSCAPSSSSWPRRGGSRTPSRHPPPTSAGPPPSSRGASSSPTRCASPRCRAARDARRRPTTTRCSAASSTCSTTRFVPHQVPADLRRAIVELETRVESTFNNFRGEIDGRRVDDNAIAEILRTSDDTDERRAAWEASKQIGPEVADRIRELARLRNQAAQALGVPRPLRARAGHRRARRRPPLRHARRRRPRHRGAVRRVEARRRRATRDALRLSRSPSCGPGTTTTPSSRTPPAEGAVAIDHLFADADLEALTVRTYDGLGLDVRSVLDHSDLYARDGKSQHAFCIDIDRSGDVRVLCNVEPSERWMDTMLHEFGHAIYDRECDRHACRGSCAAPRTRSPPRASPCSWAGCLVTRRGCARWPQVADARRRRDLAARWPTRDAPRSSCSRAGCW